MTAGADIPVTIRAFDQYDNHLTGHTDTRQFTFTWSQNTAVNSNNPSVNGQNHEKPSAGTSYTFTAGVLNLTNVFKLKNKNDSPSLNFTTSPTAPQYFGVGPFTIAAQATVDYIEILDTNANNSSWTSRYTTGLADATTNKLFYSHAYDIYGNWISMVNANWTGTGGLSGEVTGSNSTSGILNAVGVDDGTVVADAGGKTDSTGTIDVIHGEVSKFAVTASTPATAGSGISVSVTAYDAEDNLATSYTGQQPVTFSYTNASNSPAPTNRAPDKPTSPVTFSAGVYTSNTAFKLYNASNTNVKIIATAGTATGTSGAIANVAPAVPSKLVVNSLSSPVTAGTALTGSVTLRDAYDNPTSGSSNCSLSVSGWASSPGHAARPAKAPDYPAAMSPSLGVFTIPANSLKLYNATTANLSFTASGGQCSTNVTTTSAVTVNSAAVDHIWLNNSNTEPASHVTNHTCTSGSTVTCNLYAWAWDTYGNKISGDTWSCPTWSYTDTNGATGWTLGSGNHTGSLTTSNRHIDGTMRCTAGSVNSNNTTVFCQIAKTVSWSCAAWTCSATTPQRSCTLTNNTGYNIASSSIAISGTGSHSGSCTGALASGSNCTQTLSGTTGSALGTVTLTPTPSTPSAVSIAAATVTDATAAPNCTQTLSTAALHAGDGWICRTSDAKGEYKVRLTNPNELNNATFTATTFAVGPNNLYVSTDGCQTSGALKNSGTCDVTVLHPGTSQDTATLQFNESTGFFSDPQHAITGQSPICKNQFTLSTSDVTSSCDALKRNKTVKYTLSNTNTKQSGTIASIVENSAVTATLQNDNCTGVSLSPLGTCTFELNYTSATNLPTADSTNVSINMSGGSYFNALTITTGTVGNHCP